MVVKDILRYKQKGDRTEHWVKERNKPKGPGQYPMFFTAPMTQQWMMGSGTSTAATQMQALGQAQSAIGNTPFGYYTGSSLT